MKPLRAYPPSFIRGLPNNSKCYGPTKPAEKRRKPKQRLGALTQTGVLSTTLSSSSSTRTVTRGSVTRLLMEPGITGGTNPVLSCPERAFSPELVEGEGSPKDQTNST